MKTIVTFSGGKDSLAALLWVRNNFTKKFTVVFCDTGWESKITYNYIKEISEKLEFELVVVKSKKYDGFIDLAEKKKRFPSTKARFCTIELKTIPMIDYLLDEVKEDFIVIQGIRGSESESRSKMQEQCNYFKYYLEPYGTDKKGKPKFHTYRKKEILNFSQKFATDVWRPIFKWSSQQTVDYILENGLDLNPLYKEGMKRVGCFPCIMSGHKEIFQLQKRFPETIDKIVKHENEIGSSFFGPGDIPRKYYKGIAPTTREVVEYVKWRHEEGKLFDDENTTSCMSYYGLCE